MEKKELKKSNGDVFFEAEREKTNAYIMINWIGIQTIESIMMGANQLLKMLQEKPCLKIINSTKELIGPWDDGAAFLGHKWSLKAKACGVIYFAHVLAPGIYGRRSYEYFKSAATQFLKVETFEKDDDAKEWLLSLS